MKRFFQCTTFLLVLFTCCNLAAQNTPKSVNNFPIENQEQIKIAAYYFEYLFKTSNFEAMSKIIAKDAIYSQAEGLPYGGTYIGFDQIMVMFGKAQTYFDLQIIGEPTYFISDNNNEVIIYFTIKCRSKKNGNEITMPISEYFDIKNGQIKSIRPFYFDTKHFAEFLN
jgi:hypothetical protein